MNDTDPGVRTAQQDACRAIIALYDLFPALPPLYWTINTHDSPVFTVLSGQVSRSSGDQDHRRRVVADYAQVIGGGAYLDDFVFKALGSFQGINVRVYTLVDEDEPAPRPGPVINGTDSDADFESADV